MSVSSQGYLLIADITGYTQFLSSSELEHAQGILQTLMELLIAQTKPPLIVSQLEGDAVFSYGIESESMRGQTFIEMIEDTYVAFRRAIDVMVLNTTCECNACANIGTLDLKFFVHHGTFTVQRLRGKDELVGPDVIAVHRLGKNTVAEATGTRAYTMYTAAALDALDLDGFRESLLPHRESYEHLGDIDVWVQDMEPVWDANEAHVRIEIPPDDLLLSLSGVLPVPPELAWDIITNQHYRAIFVRSVRQETVDRRNGRMAAGSVYRCYHGGGQITTQTVLDWHPFEQLTTEDTTPIPGTTVMIQFQVRPAASGSEIEARVSRARGPGLRRLLCNVGGRFVLGRNLRRGFEELRATVVRGLEDGTLAIPTQGEFDATAVEAAVATSLEGAGE